MELIPTTAFGVFLAIAAAGLIFLALSVVSGGVFDFFEADHDAGPSFFSTRILAVFVTAFGAFGAIGSHYGLSPAAASAAGTLGGGVFAGLLLMFGRFLFQQQATTELRSNDLVGRSCRVVVGIPPGGVGQVRCRVGEELVDKVARARDGEPLAAETAVVVEDVLGEVVIVRKP